MGIPINQPVYNGITRGLSVWWATQKIEETIANLPESQFVLLVLFLSPEKVQKKKRSDSS